MKTRLVPWHLGIALLLLTPVAAAQTKAQKAATEAFRACHEMEDYGDATPCWKRWLEKYKNVGGEAEVMLAEERAGNKKPAPKKEEAEPPKPEPPPAEPKEEPKKEEAAAETEAEPAAEPPAEQAAVVPVAISATGPDLCASNGKQKRAVVFGVADAESLNKDAGLEAAEAPRHLNEVFLQRFPNPRFQNVVTTLAGDPKWATASSLSVGDVKAYIKSHADEGEAAALVEQSLGCSDFVVFTTLENFSSLPGEGPAGVELTMSGKMGIFSVKGDALTLVDSFEASVPSIFDKAEDKAAESAAASLDASTSSLDSANQAAANAENTADQASDAANKVGDAAKDVANGEMPAVEVGANSESCPEGSEDCAAKKPEAAPLIEKPTAGDAHERMGTLCVEASKSKDKNALLACEVRVRAYMMAKSFKESSQDVPGWQLSAPLQVADGRYTMALGKSDNISVGDGFDVLDENGNRVAYFKVRSVGPGGSEGEQKPSTLALRLGEASDGDTLSEHGMIGLGLQLHGGANFYFLDKAHYAPYGAIQSPDGWVQQQFGLPQLMYGGGGALSYDLSGLVGWSEFSVRAGGDFLLGNGTATQTRLIVAELLAEKGFYLGKGLGLYLGFGPTMTMAKVRSVPFYNPVVLGELNAGSGDIEPVAQMPGQIVDFEATRFGAAAEVGFEFLLSPNLAVRAEIPLRFSFPTKGYDSANPAKSQCPTDLTDPASVSNSPDQDSQGCWGFDTRKDTFASAGARVGAKIMF
jgi:outer membrane biosynthesis protein TonB